MTLARRSRLGAFTLTALGLATAALSAPAQAAPTYSPGDLVTVNGISVTAPTAAGSVALVVHRVDGTSQTLSVTTDDAGRVTVGDGSDVVAPVGGPLKCDDPAYTLLDGSRWASSYIWRFRKSTTQDEMTRNEASKELRRAANNITNSRNGCGLADQVYLTNEYRGNTDYASDVTAEPGCVSEPQSINVTEFGRMSLSFLAAACVYSSGGSLTDADVKLNSYYDWWEGSGSCSGSTYGLQGLQTHMFGHAVGVGDVDEASHPNLTMSNINRACSNFEARLGLGDVLALRDLY